MLAVLSLLGVSGSHDWIIFQSVLLALLFAV
uniref:Uncharacterized protein n=1 Tax=Arundo donax TaxID=35708 RepID=A0A0A9C5C0_ARUDO